MITTRYIEDEVFESQTEAGLKVRFDMRPPEQKRNMSPTETLLSATAGCVAVDVISILKKKRKTVSDLVIKTDAERKETHPRAFTKIITKYILYSPDTTQEDLYKVVKLASENYCSVLATLKADIEFDVEVINKSITK